MRAHWALGALVLCTSCKKDPPPKAAPYTFELTVSGFDLPEQGAEVVYEDTVLGRVKPKAPTVRVTLPDDVYLVEAKGRLRVRVEGTCGKQDVPLRIPFSDKQQEARALRTDVQAATFESENVTVARIYYDNQGGSSASFTIGSYNVDVAAGERGLTSAVLGNCATARQVFVSGSRVGELPTQPVMAQGPLAALIDLKGGRCYHRRVHVYVEGVQQKPEPPKPPPKPAGKNAKAAPGASVASVAPSASTTASGLPLADAIFKGQRVYPVDVIHDFLDYAPDKLYVRNDPHVIQRVELLHCEDKGRPPPPPEPKIASAAASASPTPGAPASPPAPTKKSTPSVATASGTKKRK